MTTTRVDLPALERRARAVCEMAEDLGVAARRWRDVLSAPCAPGVDTVRDAWGRDFSVYAEVLQTWCEAARAAAAGYRTTDEVESLGAERLRTQVRNSAVDGAVDGL